MLNGGNWRTHCRHEQWEIVSLNPCRFDPYLDYGAGFFYYSLVPRILRKKSKVDMVRLKYTTHGKVGQKIPRAGSNPVLTTNHRINYPMTGGFETIGMIMVYGAQ